MGQAGDEPYGYIVVKFVSKSLASNSVVNNLVTTSDIRNIPTIMHFISSEFVTGSIESCSCDLFLPALYRDVYCSPLIVYS